jgi:transcriptional regulator with XRE-family HTH domain
MVRHHAGRLSIEQAARLTGLNSGNWARWEDGARPRDRIEVSQAISEALDINLEWLMFGGATSYRPGGAGQVTNRPPRGGSKVRVDRVRPISVPAAG